MTTIPFNARINGIDVRTFYSSSDLERYKVQEKEWGYFLDTQQLGVYLNGAWHFYPSDVQLLGQIRDKLLEEPAAPVVYDHENPLITRALRVPAARTYFYRLIDGSVSTDIVNIGPCYLTRFVMINRNAAVRFCQIRNSASAPVAGTILVAKDEISLPIPAGTANNPGTLSIELAEGQLFEKGLAWDISTAETVYTAPTATEHTTHLWYVLP